MLVFRAENQHFLYQGKLLSRALVISLQRPNLSFKKNSRTLLMPVLFKFNTKHIKQIRYE